MTFAFKNRRSLSALAILLVLLGFFTVANSTVFLNPVIYRAVLTSVPISLFVVVPLVFVVTTGEIDLSFPGIIGVASWAFASAVQSGWDPFLAVIPAIIVGLIAGFVVGMLVTYVGLSSLVSTLGMSFLLRGLINLGTEGTGKQFPTINSTALFQVTASRIDNLPVQMIWGIAFVVLGWVLFNRHKFGFHARFVGDNPDSAREMGINVNHVKIMAYVFVGFGAALAGVLSVLVNRNWWPSTGEGLLLSVLAAVFVGGTPTWGGVATVVGSSIGVVIISFIETGIIAAGLTGYFTQFANGFVIIASLIGHRFNGPRYR
jgi:ribose/xylose/arabinose/galactoside ABC-type transport system permease subunit